MGEGLKEGRGGEKIGREGGMRNRGESERTRGGLEDGRKGEEIGHEGKK